MVSHFKYKLAAIYILYGLCTHTHLFDLCDLKRSHPAGAFAVYRVGWYSILYTKYCSGTQAVQGNKTANINYSVIYL